MNSTLTHAPTVTVSPRVKRLVCALGLTLLALVVARGYQASGPIIDRLDVSGELEHVDVDALRAAVSPWLGRPFFATRVSTIRHAVEQAPWVASARVERAWPNRLTVQVWEHRPIARWGEAALVSDRLRLFEPAPPLPDLPRLDGPDSQLAVVVQQWQRLSSALEDSDLALAGLRIDARGSWTATTRTGLDLRLGRGDPQRHLPTLTGAVVDALRRSAARARYIDLRYDNGFAIGWEAESATAMEAAHG